MTDQQTSDFGASSDFPDPVATAIDRHDHDKHALREELAETENPTHEYIVHPLTGGALPVDAPTDQIAHALEEHAHVMLALQDYRHELEAIIIERLDAANARSEVVGEHKFTTNAPFTESYPVDELAIALGNLVDEGILDPVVMERVITTPDPKPPAPRVDKREANKLKKHVDERVRAAVEEVRLEAPQARTLKIERA